MNLRADAPVPSPCVDVCRMDDVTGMCTGCLRTLDEIAVWSLLDDAEKRAVWVELERRRVACLPRPLASGAAPGGDGGSP
jgi:predicted Fe-S protein YdhL (DUF1289 family)